MATKKVVSEIEEKIAEAKEVVEATAKKTSGVAKKVAAGTKAAAKKTVEKATAEKPAAKKAVAKKVQETYCEINGEQILMEDLVAKVKEAYVAEGHTAASIKSVKTYINLAERKAYYVINDNAEDKYIEF